MSDGKDDVKDDIKEDRGDVVDATGDESGDTDDQKNDDVGSEDAGELNEEGKGDKDDKSKDADAGDKSKDDKKDEKKDEEPRIPKSRFDQAVAKARKEAEEAQRKLAELEEEMEAQRGQLNFEKIEEEIDALEEKLEDAIKDGNAETKQRLRKEIRRKNQEIAEAKAAQHAARATAAAIEKVTYDSLVKELEVQHPELNPDNEDTYDDDAAQELMELKEAFEAKGHGSTEALRKAVRAVYGRAPAKPKVGESKDDDAGNEDDEAKKKAEEAAAKRKEEAVKKGLDAKGQQPVDSKEAGLDSDKAGRKGSLKDPNKLSEAEWDKLTDEEKARMRGDIL